MLCLLFLSVAGGFLKIWDVREQQAALTFDAHQGGVNCLCFSENGYMLASAGEDGTAKVWDLRKQKCVKSFECKKDNLSFFARRCNCSLGCLTALELSLCVAQLVHRSRPSVSTPVPCTFQLQAARLMTAEAFRLVFTP